MSEALQQLLTEIQELQQHQMISVERSGTGEWRVFFKDYTDDIVSGGVGDTLEAAIENEQ